MDRKATKKLLVELEKITESSVLVYLTGDRFPVMTPIHEDAVLPIYKHLLGMEKKGIQKGRISLFLYTRGGDVTVPWRIVSSVREFCKKFDVLVPFKAYSAGTMIALGSDTIVMGRRAELSPIDPSLMKSGPDNAPFPEEVSVEDVVSYISFMKERANISDQIALAQVMAQLASNLTPLTLGEVNRLYSHIRLVARKLLDSRKVKATEAEVNSVISALTEKMYSHGHSIGRKEAKALGLPVEEAAPELDNLMWSLYEQYEQDLRICEPIDPQSLLDTLNTDHHKESGIPIAVVESLFSRDIYKRDFEFRRKRKVPPNLTININFALPANIDWNTLPPQTQQVLQQTMAQLSSQVTQQAKEEVIRQSPTEGVQTRASIPMWHSE